jgi:uncharacterized membrane protein YfcA
MTPSQAAILFVAAFVAGVMNAVAGGGTILTFPALIAAGLPGINANATSTLALLPGSLAGAVGFRTSARGAWAWVRRFAVVSLVGGLLGSVLLKLTPPGVFDRLVPFLILFATLLFTAQTFFRRLAQGRAETAADGADPSPAGGPLSDGSTAAGGSVAKVAGGEVNITSDARPPLARRRDAVPVRCGGLRRLLRRGHRHPHARLARHAPHRRLARDERG